MPAITPPGKNLEVALKALQSALSVFEGAVGVAESRTSLKAWGARLSSETPRAWLVGPEGDLTDEEIDQAADFDVQPVSLGPRVLKVELAVTAGLSLLSTQPS